MNRKFIAGMAELCVSSMMLFANASLASSAPSRSAPDQRRSFCVGNCLIVKQTGTVVTAVAVDRAGAVMASGSASVDGLSAHGRATVYIDLISLALRGTTGPGPESVGMQTTAPTETTPLPGGGWVTVIHFAAYDVVVVTDNTGKVVSTNIVPHGLVK